MKLNNYSLKLGKKILIDNVSLSFEKESINHLLGSNGAGKSCFAKSVVKLINYSGSIEECNCDIVLISSKSNIPLDLKLKDIRVYLEKRYGIEKVEYFYNILNLGDIPKVKIKKMSDGQKQKIKLMWFLIKYPKLIILDEFTSALDKKTALEMYRFLSKFIKDNKVTCINITHNLADLEYMQGSYYILNDKKIKKINSKEEVINLYVKGGI